jgi:hypothetical protein
MKALNLSVAFLGMILSTLGMSIAIVSVILYATETKGEVLLLNQSWWILSFIFICSLTLSYKAANLLNKNL